MKLEVGDEIVVIDTVNRIWFTNGLVYKVLEKLKPFSTLHLLFQPALISL